MMQLKLNMYQKYYIYKGDNKMRIVFMGTPKFAVPVLEKLIRNNYNIVGVVSQPDSYVGRKRVLTYPPVKELALKHNISVFQPRNLKEDYQGILDLSPDLIITAAYGQMLPNELIDKVKSINVHGSILPSYRGGAPIQKAIFDGKKETGITIMYMAWKMDSGDIIRIATVPIEDDDNTLTLTNKLSVLGAELLLEVLREYPDFNFPRTKQDETKATFAYALKREDEIIDFNDDSINIVNRVRGLAPNIGATMFINDKQVKVYLAEKFDIITSIEPGTVIEVKDRLVIAAKNGAVSITEIQVAGRNKMGIKQFLNGQNIFKLGDIVKRKESL